MKKIMNVLSVLAVISLAVLMSCGKDGGGKKKDPPGKEIGDALASGDWAPSSVSLDNTPRDEWSNFVLNFSVNTTTYEGGSYSTTGLPAEDADQVTWKPSGTWAFEMNGDVPNLSKIIRDDGVTMNLVVSVDDVDAPTSGTMNLSFTIVDPNPRVEGFYGNWVFALTW